MTSVSGTGFVNLEGQNTTFAAGQIIDYGYWVQSLNPPGFAATLEGCPLGFSIGSQIYTTAWKTNYSGATFANNGEWMWCWGSAKIATISGGGGGGPINITGTVTPSHGMGMYGWTIIQIPAGAMSDNEAIEYAINMQAYRTDAVAGQVSLLPGEQFFADSILAKVSISTPAIQMTGSILAGVFRKIVPGTSQALAFPATRELAEPIFSVPCNFNRTLRLRPRRITRSLSRTQPWPKAIPEPGRM